MSLRSLLTSVLCLAPLAAQPTYSITDIGPGCGPTLTATFTPLGVSSQQLTLHVANARPQTHSAVFFGVDQFSWRLPGTSCFLYTLPIWVKPDLTDENGETTWQRAWPNSIYGYYNIQYAIVSFDPNGRLVAELTNAVRAQRL